tara:strand:- start:2366 stop:2551 length:186 start_codon:yes stop_codon:yes gene_type:complete
MRTVVTITDAKHVKGFDNQNCSISCTFNGENVSVPLAEGNRHYDEIKLQVDEGTLRIADAE